MQSSRTLSEKKKKTFAYLFKHPNEQKKWKILKNKAAEPYLQACQMSIMDPGSILGLCWVLLLHPI